MTYRFVRRFAALALVPATFALASCGGDSSEPSNSVTVLDVTVTLVAGETCATAGQPAEFTGQSGNALTITASSTKSSLHPAFALYAPDFTTLLGTSVSAGANKSTLKVTLTTSGTQHLVVCDPDGVAGSVKILVTRPLS